MVGIMLIFCAIFFSIMLVPCIGIALLGSRLLKRLGNFPSKTPAIQMSILLKLAVIEIVSFTLLLSFFKVLVSED